MKFKGFWKGLWDLQKANFSFIKDWWLPYTIMMIVATLISACASYICIFGFPKGIFKKTDDIDELEELLNS